MSLHKSLKLSSALQRRRNVLTRAERIERMQTEEKWAPDADSAFGLPKTKILLRSAPKKKSKQEKAEETAEVGELAEE
jgi:small basic protein (TIGR04137 family)